MKKEKFMAVKIWVKWLVVMILLKNCIEIMRSGMRNFFKSDMIFCMELLCLFYI